MSTYWYFECRDHNPPLRSDGEFTQHTDDEHYFRAVRLAMRRPVEPNRDVYFFEANASRFLSVHSRCRLGLVNEYGERRALPDYGLPGGAS